MSNIVGRRKRLGVLMPSTNSMVEMDMKRMHVPGVSIHYGRSFTVNEQAVDEAAYYAASSKQYVLDENQQIAELGQNIKTAIATLMTTVPDHIMVATSANSFRGGQKGAYNFRDKMQVEAGVGISTGALSLAAALRAFGSPKRISFLTPYYQVTNTNIRRFFTEEGFEVVRDVALQAPSWLGIAEIPVSRLRDALKHIDGPDVDAIVQSGTNANMLDLAVAAEQWLGKPVIPVNAATLWHALRATGINDKIYGFGRLLEEY